METLNSVVMDWIKILVPFGLGILVGIIVRRWEINRMRPRISIQDYVVTIGLPLRDENENSIPFIVNRIRVLNFGRSGAKDCKVYLELAPNDIERTAWMLPDDNTALSLTLNVGIPEYVDLCAISEDGQTRCVTNEHGFRIRTIDSVRLLPDVGNISANIRVAFSNAQPAELRVIFLGNVIPDTNNQGRMIEFPQKGFNPSRF